MNTLLTDAARSMLADMKIGLESSFNVDVRDCYFELSDALRYPKGSPNGSHLSLEEALRNALRFFNPRPATRRTIETSLSPDDNPRSAPAAAFAP